MKWYTMNLVQNAETEKTTASISIMEEIGGWGVTAAEFVDDLKAMGDVDAISLHLLSPGGSVIDGNAILNALVQHPAEINVHIDFAASMASAIAMAGDTIQMAENGYLMIHNPWVYTMGDANDLRAHADLMDDMKTNIISAYQRHASELDASELSQMMDDETWLDADTAKGLGFIDEISPTMAVAASVAGRGLSNVPEAAAVFMKPEDVTDASEDEDTTEDDIGDTESQDESGATGDGDTTDNGEDSADAEQDDTTTSDGFLAGVSRTEALRQITEANQTITDLTGAVEARDVTIAEQAAGLIEATAKIAELNNRLESLTGGFQFTEDKGAESTATPGTSPFMAIVHGMVDDDTPYEQALVKAANEHPADYQAFLKSNTPIKGQ